MGLGSVFAKAVRDARVAMLAVFALLGIMIVAGGQVMASTYGSPEARAGSRPSPSRSRRHSGACTATRSPWTRPAASSAGTTARTSP